ncbi:MAG: hypothetical protein RBG13Loki_3591 [Promethearchaeota archaeon CR_4]|nr:MAG: hypothetical protein RBG13Loki_3591 [Candidatus Lokiarchaeota archaeon CR_4]
MHPGHNNCASRSRSFNGSGRDLENGSTFDGEAPFHILRLCKSIGHEPILDELFDPLVELEVAGDMAVVLTDRVEEGGDLPYVLGRDVVGGSRMKSDVKPAPVLAHHIPN